MRPGGSIPGPEIAQELVLSTPEQQHLPGERAVDHLGDVSGAGLFAVHHDLGPRRAVPFPEVLVVDELVSIDGVPAE